MSGLLHRVLSTMGLEEGVRQFEAALVWPRVVGEKIAEATEIKAISNGEMRVACRSNTWAAELTLLKPKILEAIAEELGRGVIKDIRFTAGKLSPKPVLPDNESKCRNLSADAEISQMAEKAAGEIADKVSDKKLSEKVREAVKTAYIAHMEKAAKGWERCSKCGALHSGEGTECRICRLE